MQNKVKISFDFDSTLDHAEVQAVAKELIEKGYNVCILTTRYSDVTKYHFPATNADLFKVAETLGIKEINFTEYRWKFEVIDSLGITIHVDDNWRDEVHPINDACKARAVAFDSWNKEWIDELHKEISEAERRLNND